MCADDFGLNSAISQGILDLARKKRITSVSVMTNMSGWDKQINQLIELDNIDVGLHINLTEGSEENSLGKILLKSGLSVIDKQKIKKSIQNQVDCFIDGLKKLPNYFDGHHHVHQMPGIREIILDIIAQYNLNLNAKFWVRSTYPQVDSRYSLLKSSIIFLYGSRRFSRLLFLNHVFTNSTFAGMSNFSNPYYFREMMKSWLSKSKNGGLIMCHPSSNIISDNTSINAQRYVEYDYLSSQEFIEDCEDSNVELVTGRDFFSN